MRKRHDHNAYSHKTNAALTGSNNTIHHLLHNSPSPPKVHSVHLTDKLVDVALPVPVITTLHKMEELAGTPAASGIRELERPEEVRGLLEMWAGGDDLVHEVLDTEDVVRAEG